MWPSFFFFFLFFWTTCNQKIEKFTWDRNREPNGENSADPIQLYHLISLYRWPTLELSVFHVERLDDFIVDSRQSKFGFRSTMNRLLTDRFIVTIGLNTPKQQISHRLFWIENIPLSCLFRSKVISIFQVASVGWNLITDEDETAEIKCVASRAKVFGPHFWWPP